jgi:hypothetical protein
MHFVAITEFARTFQAIGGNVVQHRDPVTPVIARNLDPQSPG